MATFQSSAQIYGLLSLMTLILDDDNFITWSFQFQTLLKSLDLFGYVDGSIIFPTKYVNGNDKGEIDAITSTYKEWKKTDMAILSLMLASLSFDIMDYVVESKTSREAWMRLNERYVPTSRSHVMQLKTDLYTKTKKNDSIEKYLLKVTRTRNQLAAIGVRMEDDDIVVVILNGLPAEFNLIKGIIRAREFSISMAELRILLLNAERDIANRELVKNSGFCERAESQIICALSENSEGGEGDRIGTVDIYGNREYGVGSFYNKNGWGYIVDGSHAEPDDMADLCDVGSFSDKYTYHGDIVVFGSVCDKTASDRDLFTLEVPSDGNNAKFLSYGAEKGENAESGNLGNNHSKKAEMSNSSTIDLDLRIGTQETHGDVFSSDIQSHVMYILVPLVADMTSKGFCNHFDQMSGSTGTLRSSQNSLLGDTGVGSPTLSALSAQSEIMCHICVGDSESILPKDALLSSALLERTRCRVLMLMLQI